MLMKLGANASFKDTHGRTASKFAELAGNRSRASLLEKRGNLQKRRGGKRERSQLGHPQPKLLLEVSAFEVSLPCRVQQDPESPRSQLGREPVRSWVGLNRGAPVVGGVETGFDRPLIGAER